MKAAIGCLTALIFSLSCLSVGQEGPSLAELARKVRAAKNAGSKAAASASSSAVTPAKTSPVDANVPLSRLNNSVAASNVDANGYLKTAETLLDQENFEELDRLAAQARTDKVRFAGGGWHLYTFYVAVTHRTADPDATDEDAKAAIQKLQRWTTARPQSITAQVALADAYLSWAWKARGSGLADTVKEDAWPIFEDRVRQARTILTKAWELPVKCPQWFLVMQQVARADGWDREKINALFEKAIAFEPDYYYNYEEHARFLLPQWYGEEGEAAKFAGEAADRIGGKRGDILYFQIAAALDCNCTKETYLSYTNWPRIRRGYDALEELYGAYPLKLNQIAYMAVKAGDPEYADRIFTRIGDNWNQSIWQDSQYFQKSREWAASQAAEMKVQMALLKTAYISSAKNIQTPEGQQYDTKISQAFAAQYAAALMTCINPEELPEGLKQFDILMQVSPSGKPEQVVFWPNLVPDGCLRPKLTAGSLPVPPQADYWVKITMNLKP